MNISPLTTQESVIAREGTDLVLTMDRSVQYLVEEHLQRGNASSMQRKGAPSL